MKANRDRLYPAAFCAVVVIWVIVEAAMLPPPPYDTFHLIALLCLIVAGAGAAGGIIWAMQWGGITQGRLAQRELNEAIELAAVMMVDEHGIIRHWSRGCEQIYGWAAHEAIGRRRRDLLGTDVSVEMGDIDRLLRENGRADFEGIERHRDGRALGIDNHAKLFDHRDGRLSTVYAVTDATARRQAEIALRLSEMRLATAVAVQGIFIYEYDLLLGRSIWTSPGEAFFGLASPPDRNILLDEAWISAIQSDQIKPVLAQATAARRDRVHFDFDFHYPDRTPRRAEGWIKIIYNDEGTAVRLLGTYLDVTERRDQEALLRAGEAEKQAILATVPDAMLVCGDRGIIRSCSSTAEQLFGHDAAELIGANLLDLVAKGDGRATVRRALARALRDPDTTPPPMLANVCCADGTIVPVSFVVGQAVVDGTRMFVIFGRDMRPSITTEEKFHRLRNDLAKVARLGMMGEMAGALAHELSQPLAAIVNFLGAADLMLDGSSDDESEQLRFAVQCASEQASRAGEIIRRLRAFILRGEADMRAEPLGSLVREAAALALFKTQALRLRLTYDFEDENRILLCDRVQIQQVLVNLIRNAADAMTGSGNGRSEMLVSSRLNDDGLIRIAVRDSGPGIAPEVLEQLFSPFATTKREGLGFGLAISRRIVEAHGGQLAADAAPGGGAIFHFTLPVMEEGAA